MEDRDNAAALLQGSQEQNKNYIKLDYSIQEPEKRVELVKQIVDNALPEKLTHKYLQTLSNYIIFAMDKKERKEKTINTDNRMVTINRRETSFEGLVSKFETGEDGIYNMIINDKNVILTPKYEITQEDIDTIPALKQLREEIAKVEEQEKQAFGKRKYMLKRQIIEMRQDQYVIKSGYKPVTYCLNLTKSMPYFNLTDKLAIDDKGDIINKGLLSFFNPAHISILLCNYSSFKMNTYNNFTSDLYYMMKDLDEAVDRALKDKEPLLYDLLIYKIDGKSNLEIQSLLYSKYGITHSVEYISSLWRKKIPKLIAEAQQKRVLVWYYTNVERGKWKKCSQCGQIKLAHNKFFSKNNTAKDGWYSMCKDCRNKRNKEKKVNG